MAGDPRTFSQIVGYGTLNRQIIEARWRFIEALTAELCEPVEICIAARALQNAHARSGWTGWQSHFDFLNFLPLAGAAAQSYTTRSGAPIQVVHAAILEGQGGHHQFGPPNIEDLAPFTAVNAEADAFARARYEELPRRPANPTSCLPASLAMLATQPEHEPEGRFANLRNAIGSFLRRPVR